MPTWVKPIETGLIICLFVATAWVFRTNKFVIHDIIRILKDPDLYTMMFMIFSILAFKKSLEGSGAVGLIAGELLALNIPVVFIAVLLPFIVGLITGISVAFVGISLPVLIPLIASAGQGTLIIPFMMLIMISGFCGVLLSPLHLCFILSNRYFMAPMADAYKVLTPLALILLTLGLSAFYFTVYMIS